jgi:hypothetical protein
MLGHNSVPDNPTPYDSAPIQYIEELRHLRNPSAISKRRIVYELRRFLGIKSATSEMHFPFNDSLRIFS